MQDEGIEPDVHFLVRGFLPAVDIVKFAEENGYDHIIVGSHGMSGIDRILLGSVADGVVHRSHCPDLFFPSRTSELKTSITQNFKISETFPELNFLVCA